MNSVPTQELANITYHMTILNKGIVNVGGENNFGIKNQ